MTQEQEIARLQRLKGYIQKLGGPKQVAQQSGISLAQLYRYLQGGPIPHERLLCLAQLGEVSIDWLLNGDRTSVIQLELLLNIVGNISNVIQSTLQLHEINPAYRPSEMQHLIPLFVIHQLNYQSAYPHWKLQELDVLRALEVLKPLKTHANLGIYNKYLQSLYIDGNTPLTEEWSGSLCSLVDQTTERYFNSFIGRKYYERVSYQVKPEAENWLKNLVSYLEKTQPTGKLSVVDFGSGTGRYLRYLHLRYPDWLQLRGIERSPIAHEYYQTLYQLGELPQGTIQNADWLTMENLKPEAHAVTAYMSLHYQPLVEKSYAMGIGRLLWQMAKALRPNGLMQLVVRQGLKEIYLPYYSRSPHEAELTALLQPLGLKPLMARPNLYHNKVPPGHEVPMGFEYTKELIYQKNS